MHRRGAAASYQGYPLLISTLVPTLVYGLDDGYTDTTQRVLIYTEPEPEREPQCQREPDSIAQCAGKRRCLRRLGTDAASRHYRRHLCNRPGLCARRTA